MSIHREWTELPSAKRAAGRIGKLLAERSLRRSDSGWILLLVLCAVLPYANTLFNGFVYDDGSQIMDNPYVRSFRYLRQIFGSSVFSYTGIPSHYYRPMMTFGYLLCYKVFGFSPTAFHLVNICLHAAIVGMLFVLTRRIFGNRIVAFGAAALFALHPIHTESVAWIAAVTDLELTFFYLLTFWFFLALGHANGRRPTLLYLAMAGSFSVALLSKEQAVTLPFLAMVYEHFYREDRNDTNWARKVSRYLPLGLLAVAYLPVRMMSLGGFVVTSNHWGLTRFEILLSAIALTGQYLWKLLWPVNLCAFYVFDKSSGVLEPPVLAGSLGWVLLCAGFWWLWKRARPVSFGLIWLMVTLAPVLNPRWLGVNVFAERYLYLPSIGFCWIAAWGLGVLWTNASNGRTLWRQVLIASLSVVALLSSFRIVLRNRDWRDNLTLYARTLEASPNAVLIQGNLAAEYQSQGLLQEAERLYRAALERVPDCAKCMNDLAWLYMEQQRYADAKPILVRAVTLDPNVVSARLNLGIVYQGEGMIDRAVEQFRAAEALSPQNVYVHTTLAWFYEKRGEHSLAEAAFQRALSINPYHSQARISLGSLYETEHRPAEAVREYQAALQNEPGNFEAIAALQRLQAPPKP